MLPESDFERAASSMKSQDEITINRDEATQLYIARCLYCDEVVVAGKDRRITKVAAAVHHCDSKPKPA